MNNNMPRLQFIVILLSLHFSCLAGPLDSLWKAYGKADDTSKIKLLISISNAAYATDFDSSLHSLQKAVTIAKGVKDKKWLCMALKKTGNSYHLRGNYDKAIAFFIETFKVAEANALVRDMADAQYYLAVTHSKIGNNDIAIGYLLDAGKGYEKLHDESEYAWALNNLGICYKNKNDFEKALFYHQQCLNIRLKLGKEKDIAASYMNLGTTYSKMKALDKALEYYMKSKELREKSGDMLNLTKDHLNIASVLHETGRDQEALAYAETSLQIAEKYNYRVSLKDVTGIMARIHRALGNTRKCNEFLFRHNDLKDSIFSEESARQVAEMQTRFEVELKEHTIEMLNKDKLIQEEKLAQEKAQRNMFIIITAVTGLFLLFAVFAYRNIRRANHVLTRQKQEILAQTEQLNRQAAEIAMYKAQMNPHFIFNVINSVQRYVVREDKTKALDYLQEFSALMRQMLSNSDKEMLTLNEECEFLNRYVMFEQLRCDQKFSFETRVDEGIDPSLVAVPPMIIQPFIENAIRHGLIPKQEQGQLRLVFSRAGGEAQPRLQVAVEDDGIGREEALKRKKLAARVHESKGMEITVNRIKKFNARYGGIESDTVEITDIYPHGTRVKFTIPLIELF